MDQVKDRWASVMREIEVNKCEARVVNLGLTGVNLSNTWAANSDLLDLLMREITDNRPRTIVELGTGTSTLVMAKILDQMGLDTQIYSVEHNPQFARETRRRLEENGLSDRVEIVDAPIINTPFGRYYDLDKLLRSLFSVDLLLVDGPPGNMGPQCRYPALHYFHPLLSGNSTVILNNGRREDERQVARRWTAEYRDLSMNFIDNSAGCFLFRKQPVVATPVEIDLVSRRDDKS